jgi:hypothetical protein
MDRWLLLRSRYYGQISCYTAALDRFDPQARSWWKTLRYDMHLKGQSSPNTWEEVKRLVKGFVPTDCMVE